MENNKPVLDMHYTAEQLKERLEKELPIMRQNLASLESDDDGVLFRLPMAVHNISLCVSERVYLFIEPTLKLYKMALPKKILGIFKQSLTADEKEIEKRVAFMEELLSKERRLYNKQLEEAKADIKREKKDATDKTKIATLRDRMEAFSHVEVDMYEFLLPYMMLVVQGKIEFGDEQKELLNVMRNLALYIFRTTIPKRETTLDTCNKVLASNNVG